MTSVNNSLSLVLDCRCITYAERLSRRSKSNTIVRGFQFSINVYWY